MVGNHRHRVGGRDKCIVAINHVAVTIAVGCRAKSNFLGVNSFDEGVSVGQIGVGVAAAKVCGWVAVLGRGRGETEFGLEDADAVWAGDCPPPRNKLTSEKGWRRIQGGVPPCRASNRTLKFGFD